MTYDQLSQLEMKARAILKALERAEQTIEDDCCAGHGLGEVEKALTAARSLHASIASAMLDAFRSEASLSSATSATSGGGTR